MLVSITVIALLVSILLPSLSMVRENTRRVICSSNIRQVGLALSMYTEDNLGFFPRTSFISPSQQNIGNASGSIGQPVNGDRYQNAMLARLQSSIPGYWDGLGHLFEFDYLDHYGAFYCLSHRGDVPLLKFKEVWSKDAGELVINYQYRGVRSTESLDPATTLLADGMRTASDFNHQVGTNVLRADYSTLWITQRAIVHTLPVSVSSTPTDSSKVKAAWEVLDRHSAN